MSFGPLAVVSFWYRRSGGTWTVSRWSGRTLQALETLVLQELRRVKPGCEIDLIELQWRQ